ncbi:unnamed protein product, partial [Brenthis ino]
MESRCEYGDGLTLSLPLRRHRLLSVVHHNLLQYSLRLEIFEFLKSQPHAPSLAPGARLSRCSLEVRPQDEQRGGRGGRGRRGAREGRRELRVHRAPARVARRVRARGGRRRAAGAARAARAPRVRVRRRRRLVLENEYDKLLFLVVKYSFKVVRAHSDDDLLTHSRRSCNTTDSRC